MENKNNINYIFFIIFIVLAFVVIVRIIAPFAMIIFFAAVFSTILKPFYIKLVGKAYYKQTFLARIKKTSLAVLFSIVALLIFLIPVSLLIYSISVEFVSMLNILDVYFTTFDINKLITDVKIQEILNKLPIKTSVEEIVTNIQNSALSQVSSISKYLTFNVASLIKNIGGFITSFIFMMFSLFFFFLDGDYLKEQFIKLVPIEDKYAKRLLYEASKAVKGIIYGNLFTGIFQAFCAFIVFVIFRIENSLVFASLIVVASFIPVIGTSIIWIPLGIAMMLGASVFKGVLFIIISAIVITLPDNFVRPILLGNRIELHPLFIFFSILGGILTFGLPGIILGPLIVILFFESMKIFDEIRHTKQKRKRRIYG